MKTINLLTTIALVFICTTLANAQRTVALHSTSGVKMYSGLNPFVDAYNAAIKGDTIYLPGGSFTSPATIDKQLFIYGAGFHPDSTGVTLPTLITQNINPGENADGLVMEGIEFAAATTIADNVSASNMTFRRCRFDSYIAFYGNATTKICTGNLFAECILIGEIVLNNVSSSMITNCILQNRIQESKSNTIKNNIFLYNANSGSYSLLANPRNNEISNNAFVFTESWALIVGSNTDGNIYYNNIFVNSAPVYGPNAITKNNYAGVTQTNIFVNQTGYTFDYTHDYHLKNPGTYLGTDGSQASIYGGIFPYKTGAVPSNPHIQSKNIASATNNTGQLQIQIKVEAQNK